MSSSQNELFSFAVITYKDFNGIFETLGSLFKQDYPRIELIIADDGSPNYDDEIGAIRDFIDTNKRDNIENVIYSHFETNRGTVANMNNAMALANGYYVKSLGCEDTLATENALSKYVQFMKDTGYNLVFAKLVGVTDGGIEVKHLQSCEDDYDMLRRMSSEELCNKLYIRNFFPAPAWAGTKTLFEKNGMFPTTGRLIEDYPYWIQVCQNGEPIGFMDDVLIHYKLSGVSSTGNYGVAFMEDMFKIYNKHIIPYDRRFGIFQGFYNFLKISGLKAYMSKAKWKDYTISQKLGAIVKYGLFYMYIAFNDMKNNLKNRFDR